MSESATPWSEGFRLPAEWEPHRATWIAWPHNESDWPGCFDSMEASYVELVSGIHHSERVEILVQSERAGDAIRRALVASGVDVDQVGLHVAATNRSWARDFAPIFVTDGQRLGAVKWRFDGWARYPDHGLDDAAGRAVARWSGARVWEPEARVGNAVDRVVLEGGGIDGDGEGTLLVSETWLFSEPHGRMRGRDRAFAEGLFRQFFGTEQVIWVGEGIAGDDTFGHVDDFVRFVAPGRVVVAEAPSGDADFAALSEAAARVGAAVDARGRTPEVVRVPLPRPRLHEGDRLPASYVNFYVCNDRVLVPTFDDPADDRALGVLREQFEDRDVVGVAASSWVVGLGTLHCSTQQEPRI